MPGLTTYMYDFFQLLKENSRRQVVIWRIENAKDF